MEYMGAYRFVFSSPNWIKNVLLCAVCSLVPIAGQMVLFGYLFEIIETLHKRGKNAPAPGESYPNFELNKITDYLMRGIVPTIVALALGFLAAIVIGVVYGIGVAIMALVGKMGGVVVGIVGLFLFLFVTLLGVAAAMIILPFLLRAGLTRDFGSALSVPFAKDFLSRVGKETLISVLFMDVSGTILMGIGVILCIIGVYPAAAIVTIAYFHIIYQLYEVYLGKGGEQIPIKPPTPQPL
jgi:hypothetical protein